VKDSIEYPHKSYCRSKLVVIYFHDNKAYVHVKHIVIKIKLMLWKKNIQDQTISLEQIRIYRSANQRLAAYYIQRTTIDMGLW
jgi:hypothetical protein